MSIGAVQSLTATYQFKLLNFDYPRWGPYEQQNWTKLDAILTALSGGLAITGYWTPNTIYHAADIVVDGSVNPELLYVCYADHTSGSSTFAADRTAHPTYWIERSSVPAISLDPTTVLLKANNLGDLTSVAAALANLGSGSIGGPIFAANNITTALNLLGVGTAGVQVFASNSFSVIMGLLGATTIGTQIFQAADAAAVRTAINAGQGTVTTLTAPAPNPITVTNPTTTPALAFDMAVFRGHITGLELSYINANTIGITSGQAMSDDVTTLMKVVSNYNKTTASWLVGSTTGMLDTGTVAINTWYHVFEIMRPDTGVTDFLMSTNISAPTMPTNYTKKRRIGSILTDGSAQIIQFFQYKDEVVWKDHQEAYNSGLTTSAILITLAVPPGLNIRAQIAASAALSGFSPSTIFTSPDQTDVVPGTLNSAQNTLASPASQSATGLFELMTDTSSRIRARSGSSGGVLAVNCVGYKDIRGRLS